MNIRVEDYNGRDVEMVIERDQKVQRFQAMNFGITFAVSFWLLTLVLGGGGYGRRRGKKHISGNKRKTCFIRVKAKLYKVCVSILFYLFSSLLYYDYTNTHPPPDRFVASYTPGARIPGSIGHINLHKKRTRNIMNGGGKFC